MGADFIQVNAEMPNTIPRRGIALPVAAIVGERAFAPDCQCNFLLHAWRVMAR
jgi:hypothetical protein